MVMRTTNKEIFDGYQPEEKNNKVYCCYCKHFKYWRGGLFEEEKFYCKLEKHFFIYHRKPTQIYKPQKKYENRLIKNGALEKNKNNNCPDFKPNLKCKLLGKHLKWKLE